MDQASKMHLKLTRTETSFFNMYNVDVTSIKDKPRLTIL